MKTREEMLKEIETRLNELNHEELLTVAAFVAQLEKEYGTEPAPAKEE